MNEKELEKISAGSEPPCSCIKLCNKIDGKFKCGNELRPIMPMPSGKFLKPVIIDEHKE